MVMVGSDGGTSTEHNGVRLFSGWEAAAVVAFDNTEVAFGSYRLHADRTRKLAGWMGQEAVEARQWVREIDYQQAG